MLEVGLGILLIVFASFLDVPAIILLGLVLLSTGIVRELWRRRGLDGIEYRRRLPRPRGVVGDEIALDISVWNRKPLPLAWLTSEDEADARVVVRERELAGAESAARTLHNAWTLAPYERVVRHFHVVAERRGVYGIGPVRLEVGDLLARPAAALTLPGTDSWIVRPRSVAVRTTSADQRWGGDLLARRGLLDDPTRYAGVRPYQPGDALRAVHWKATARLGHPVSKRFDPARQREVVVALDIELGDRRSRTAGDDDELVEGLCVAAASLVRHLRAGGATVGLAAAAYGDGARTMAYVPPAGSEQQWLVPRPPRPPEPVPVRSVRPAPDDARAQRAAVDRDPRAERPRSRAIPADPSPRRGVGPSRPSSRVRPCRGAVRRPRAGRGDPGVDGGARRAVADRHDPRRRTVNRSAPRARTIGRGLDLLPTLLALVAEGSWIGVVHALLGPPPTDAIDLSPIVLAGFAAVGLLVGRGFAPRLGRRWPAAAVGLTCLAAVAGWLSATTTRSALASPEPLVALLVNPAGWLTGLAFIRGLAHAQPTDEGVRSPIPIGLPVIAVAILVGGAIAEPGRSAFLDAALPSTIVFVATATLATALGRASALGRTAGFDWQANPAWLGLLIAFVAGVLVLAVPASHAVGAAVIVFIGALPVPLLILGLVVGLDRRLLRVLVLLTAVIGAIVVVIRLVAGPPSTPDPFRTTRVPPIPTPNPEWLPTVGILLLLVLAGVGVGVLAAIWMRRAPERGDGDVAEERTIDFGAGGASTRLRRPTFRLRRSRPPSDGPTAYLAMLRELAADPALERRAGETPAEHARRLREGGIAGRVGRAVDLLAADYELAQFGSVRLTPGENRRALARWRRIRSAVRP